MPAEAVSDGRSWGMIGALMMVFAMGNVNVLSSALKNLTMDPQAPSRGTWQLALSFFLALALFINHFLITSTNYRTSRRIMINQILILAILLSSCSIFHKEPDPSELYTPTPVPTATPLPDPKVMVTEVPDPV